jgi:hypothetical protein
MQRKTDKEVKNAVDRIDKTVTRIDEVVDKMNQITERQHDIITNEDERRKRMKSYPLHHIIGLLKGAKTKHEYLKQHIECFVNDRSEENRRRILSDCKIYGPSIYEHDIPFIKDQVMFATPYLNNPWLANKFLDGYILGQLANIFLAIKNVEQEDYYYLDRNTETILTEIDEKIRDIDKYINLFEKERD